MFKTILKTTMGCALALGVVSAAQASDVTLRLGHLWPPVAGPHKALLKPWADKVMEASGGKIDVQIYPSGTLAKPPAQYDAVKGRLMDITATVLGYTANRFPLTQIVEMPGIAKNAVHGSCIVQNLYNEGLLDSEFKDTHPLFMFTHGPGLIHTSEKAINTPEDFKGLRIRRPTTLVAKMMEGLGAQPVGMPAPASYQSMQRGVIDGVAFPWEGALSFRLNELANHHTEVGGLYTIVFLVTMNKDVYNSMSPELKKVIDDNSGLGWANTAGEVFDGADVKGRKQAQDAGHNIVTVEGGVNNPAWKPVLDKAAAEYLAELNAKGLPADKVHARTLELAKTCM